MPIYHEVAQRSAAWHILRLGKPTASSFDRIVTPKGKLSAQAKDYMQKLLAEQMLGRVIEEKPYKSECMERGERLEEDAVKAYSLLREVEVRKIGFVTVDSGLYGCSPDGLCGDDGGLELKIPAPQTHVGYLLNPASLAEGYAPQIQGCMLVCERDHWDPFSYHEHLPPVLYRIKRDEPYIKILRESLGVFCDTMAEMRLKLEREHGPFPEPQVFDPTARCASCRRVYESKYIGTNCSACEGTIVSQADVDAVMEGGDDKTGTVNWPYEGDNLAHDDTGRLDSVCR